MPFPIRGGSRGKVLFVMVLLAVTLITIDVRGNSAVDGVRSTSRDWFSPVRDTFGKIFHPFENLWHGVRDYDNLRRDYLVLKDEVSRNQGVSIDAEVQVRELNDLRAQNGLLPCSAITKMLAEVVGRPATNYESALEINRGSLDGLRQGMPVITPAGLVGSVGKVSEHHAFVQLLFDPSVQVAVNILGTANLNKTPQEVLENNTRINGGILVPSTTTLGPNVSTTTTTSPPVDPNTGEIVVPTTTTVAPTTTLPPTTTTTILVPIELGIMHGNGRDKPITVDNIRGVKVGDPIVTSGSDASLMPGCIPVGRVKSVAVRKGSSQLDVVVEPVADLDRIGLVTVMLWDPERRPPPAGTPVQTTTSIPPPS